MEYQGNSLVNKEAKCLHKAPAFFALLLQVVGFVTPGWMIMNVNTRSRISFGIWYYVGCGNDGCETVTLVNFKSDDLVNVKSRQIQTTIALAFTISAIVLIMKGTGPFTPQTLKIKMVASLTALVSGILSLACSGLLANETLAKNNGDRGSYYKNVFGFPYSLFLFALGGVVLCILAFLLLLDVLHNLQVGTLQGALPGQINCIPGYQQSNQPYPVNVAGTMTQVVMGSPPYASPHVIQSATSAQTYTAAKSTEHLIDNNKLDPGNTYSY